MGEFELNEVTIIDVMDDLRKPNGDKLADDKIKDLIIFDDAVIDMWKKLEMEGTPNPQLIEFILISLIENAYKSGIQKKNKKKVRIRDATLLSFGLLDGYYHTKTSTEKKINVWLEDRYEDYLSNSDFIKVQYSDCKTYQEIKKLWEQSESKGENPPLNLLIHSAGDGKKKIASELLEIIRNKTYKQYLDKDGNVPEFDFPNPYFTLANFPLAVEPKSEPISSTQLPKDDYSDETEEQGNKEEGHGDEPIEPELPEPTPPSVDSWGKARTIAFNLCIFLIALVIISGVIDFVSVRLAISSALKSAEQEPALVSIRFDNPFEYLSFGDDLNLTVIPTPSDAALKGLKCKSSAPNIVEIKSESALHIKAAEASKNSKTCDVDIEAYMDFDNDIKDEMVIHVIKNGEIESRGKGSQTGN